MGWTEERQGEIERLLSQQDPREILAVCVSKLIEAKIDAAIHNLNIGQKTTQDPMQVVDFQERLLAAVLDRFALIGMICE